MNNSIFEFMLKILIVEDDVIFAKQLKKDIENLGYEVVAISNNADDAIEILKKHKVDLVLIDIELKGKKNGIEVAKFINKNNRIPFIYLSVNSGASNPYFIVANATKPANYLPKGFLPNQLNHFIEMAMVHFANMENGIYADGQVNCFVNDELFIKEPNGAKWKRIIIDEVTHIIVAKPVCKIWVNNNMTAYTLRGSLDYVLKKFNTKNLIRINQSYAVNSNFIDKIDAQNNSVILINNIELLIGRTFKKPLFDALSFLE